MSDYNSRYYQSSDGLRLHYRHYTGPGGELVPVVCLPGITRNCRDFEDLAPRLAKTRTVLTPDLRGRGLSERDPHWQNYQPLTYVQDIVQLLDTLDIARCVFVGTSLGGIVAMLVAALHPGRVAGVVLNDIGPEVGSEGLDRIREYIGRAEPVRDWDGAVAQAHELYDIAWPDLDDATWHRVVRRVYREDDRGRPVLDMDPKIGDAARTAGTSPGDPWQLFKAMLPVPALVVQGATSDILTDEIVARMLREKPDLGHARIPNRGHVPLLDETDSLAAIDAFMKDCP